MLIKVDNLQSNSLSPSHHAPKFAEFHPFLNEYALVPDVEYT